MYNEELVKKICENLYFHPLVKIKRPMSEITTRVSGIVFEKSGPRLYLEDYPNINLNDCMEDVEWVSSDIGFENGEELLTDNVHIREIFKPNKIYKIIDNSFEEECYWIFRFAKFVEDDIMSYSCIGLELNKKTGKYEVDYMNNMYSRFGSYENIISIKECNEAESTTFSYAIDALYPNYIQEKIIWDDIIKEF